MRATRRRRYIYASFKYACQHVLRLQHQSSSDSLLLSLLMSPSTPLIIPRGSFLGACDEEASPLRLFRPDKTASRTASLVDSASTSSILAVSFWLIFSVLGAESSKLSWVPCASHVPQRLITTGRRGLSSTSEVIMSSSFSNTSRPSETLPTTWCVSSSFRLRPRAIANSEPSIAILTAPNTACLRRLSLRMDDVGVFDLVSLPPNSAYPL
mmetsp:Transcript_38722/g.99022  ORF Transcript_38722/g.99022 Transcript_38722/m.99022 type:complete len:211 (+) Transcript_38722:32-664(+)